MRKLLIIGAIILGILIYLFLRESSAPRQSGSTPNNGVPVETPIVETPPPTASSAPSPIVNPQAQIPRATPPPDPRIPNMQRLAATHGVRLENVEPAAGGAYLTVSWVSDNSVQGLDYIDALRLQGVIRDLDINQVQTSAFVSNGRRGWRTRILVFY